MEIVVIWIVVAIVAAIVANNKGRSGARWFFLCLLLSPLAILVLLALPALNTKVCPRCAETVKSAAKVCRFCGYEFPSNELSFAQPSETEGKR
jgi:tRNA(Ile2) C34 agmatinyltransferase TiaS